ncbi:hypothetical protein DIPPA_34546 [Diplonema papillatum]|nr:hypothetical protein DIPPA_34546 [Diplonema papillatum]
MSDDSGSDDSYDEDFGSSLQDASGKDPAGNGRAAVSVSSDSGSDGSGRRGAGAREPSASVSTASTEERRAPSASHSTGTTPSASSSHAESAPTTPSSGASGSTPKAATPPPPSSGTADNAVALIDPPTNAVEPLCSDDSPLRLAARSPLASLAGRAAPALASALYANTPLHSGPVRLYKEPARLLRQVKATAARRLQRGGADPAKPSDPWTAHDDPRGGTAQAHATGRAIEVLRSVEGRIGGDSTAAVKATRYGTVSSAGGPPFGRARARKPQRGGISIHGSDRRSVPWPSIPASASPGPIYAVRALPWTRGVRLPPPVRAGGGLPCPLFSSSPGPGAYDIQRADRIVRKIPVESIVFGKSHLHQSRFASLATAGSHLGPVALPCQFTKGKPKPAGVALARRVHVVHTMTERALYAGALLNDSYSERPHCVVVPSCDRSIYTQWARLADEEPCEEQTS